MREPPHVPLYREHPSRFHEREGCFLATYTENFGLHQWVPEDDFLRTDFNTDFQKIDAALGTIAAQAAQVVDKCRVLYGSFAGDGATTRAITLGVRPKVVTLVNCSTMVDYVTVGVTSLGALVITDTGFQTGVSHGQGQNSTSALYLYVALV